MDEMDEGIASVSPYVNFPSGTRGVIGIGRLSADANRAGGSLDKSGGND